MTSEVGQVLAEHAAGNLRVLANMAHDLLEEAVRKNRETIDAQLYHDLFNQRPTAKSRS
jgi:hypothetical protein